MKAVFVALQALAVSAIPTSLALFTAEKYMEAGISFFIGIIALIVYEYLPETRVQKEEEQG